MRSAVRFTVLGGALAALVVLNTGQGCSAAAATANAPLSLRPLIDAPQAREAIARVVYAEAAGQGDSGLAGVVFTILNRLGAGAWGGSIDQVVNARAQFEPVLRAGGDWRGLPAASPAQRARIDTILNLALDGRLPDPTGGALYFQNPRIVAARAATGAVSSRLVHFGGATPSAVIGDHAFYPKVGVGSERTSGSSTLDRAGGPIFASAPAVLGGDALVEGAIPSPAVSSPGERGVFVRSDGAVVEDRP